MNNVAEIAKLDQQLTFCRRELREVATIASEQHNAVVAYLRSHSAEHSTEGHTCELCEVANKLQRRISKIPTQGS